MPLCRDLVILALLLLILSAVALAFSLDPTSPTARLINELFRSCKNVLYPQAPDA